MRTHCARLAGALAAVAALSVAGCASRYYPNEGTKNVEVRPQLQAASTLGSIRAVVGVHRVSPECRADYQGYVPLQAPRTELALAPQQTVYLVFEFETSSFLGSSRGTVRQATLLTPRAGASYEIDAIYRDQLYQVVVRERAVRQAAARELPLRPLHDCRR